MSQRKKTSCSHVSCSRCVQFTPSWFHISEMSQCPSASLPCLRITTESSEISSFLSPIVFLSFFSHFLLSYSEYFSDCTEHISLIPYQIPSVGLSFHPRFTILTSSAVLDRLNICSRRKTRVYVSLAYAETISIR